MLNRKLVYFLFCISLICLSADKGNSQCNITPELTGTAIQNGSGNNPDYILVCTGVELTGAVIVNNGISSSFFSNFNSYTINWGDGSTNFTTTSDNFTNPAATHLYSPGVYTLIFSATTSSCTVINEYEVYVGQTPVVSMGTPGGGGTEGCSEVTISFPISDTEDNFPNTTYEVIFSDGSPSEFFNQPPPAFVSHTFDESSCGQTFLNSNNSYGVTIIANNGCTEAQVSVAPVRISDPPVADFTFSQETICTSGLVSFDDTSDPGTTASAASCTSNARHYWSITPATGWSVAAGTTGSNNGLPNSFSVWTSGSDLLDVNFTAPGTYNVSLNYRNSCGPSSKTETICVIAPPICDFDLNNNSGCGPLSVVTDNNTVPPVCGNDNINLDYDWNIIVPAGGSYTLQNGSLTSTNPTFNFTNTTTATLTYTIELTVTPINPQTGAAMTDCSSFCSQTVTVYPAPIISVHPTPNQTICVGGTPTSLTVSYLYGVGTPTYQWYSNSTNSNTGGTIINGATSSTYLPPVLNTVGNYYYYAVITLGGSCGTIKSNPACVSVVADPTISTQPISTQTICSGGSSALLQLNYANGTGTPNYQWYSNSSSATTGGTAVSGAVGPSFTPTIPTTPGTYYFYGTVGTSGSGCNSTTTLTAQITVISDPVVSITPTSATYCQNASATPIVSSVTGGSGTPSYQWFQNTTASNVGGTAISGQTSSSFTPPTNTVGTQYYYVNLTQSVSGCSNVSPVISITILPAASINLQPQPSTVCVGGTPTSLSVQYINGTGTPSYQWYSSNNSNGTGGTIINGATSATYTPPAASAGVIYYYVVVSFASGGCSNITSIPAAVTVIADPSFTVQPNQTTELCLGGSLSSPLSFVVTGGTGTLSYQWYSNNSASNSGGTAISGATSTVYSPSPYTSPGTFYYYATVSASGNGCQTAATSVSSVVVVNDPTIVSQPLNSQTLCQNSIPQNLSATVSGGSGSASYVWYSNTTNTNSGGTQVSTNATFTPPTNTIGTIYYYVIITQTGSGCSVTSSTGSVTVTPSPSITIQPSPSIICQGGTPTVLSVSYNNGLGTPNYQWYSSLSNNGSNPTTILGANASSYTPPSDIVGVLYYYVEITFSGGGCSNLLSNIVAVTVIADPSISTQPLSPQTLCIGSALATPLSFVVAGGTGNLSYQWYTNSTATNNNGTLIPGATLINYNPPTFNTAGTFYYYAVVSASGNGCQTAATNAVQITINPAATSSVLGPFVTCGASAVNINATANGTGSWTASPNAGVFGTASNTSTTFTPNNSTSQTITLTWTTADPDGSGPCPAVSSNSALTVYPPATASLTATSNLCSNASLPLSATTNAAGTWSSSSNGTFAPTNNAITTYTPGTNDSANSPVTLTWTTTDPDGAGPCTSASASQQVTINSPPVVNAGIDQTLCLNSSAINLSGTPASGTWTGTGVTSAGSFNPTTIGTFNLTYTYTNTNNCTSTDQLTINVNQSATADAQGPYTACGITPVNITAITNGTGSWSGGTGTFANATSAATTYTPALGEIGTTITLTWNTVDPDNTGPCSGASDTAQLTVNTPASATPGGPYTICSSDIANIVVTTTPGGGTWSGGTGAFGSTSSSSTTYDPSATETGAAVTLTWTTVDPDNSGPCPTVTANVIVNVLSAAIADAQGPYATCGISPVNITAIANGAGTWTGGAGTFANATSVSTTYTPTAAEIGTTITLTWETFDPDNTGPCNNAIDTAQLTISTPATATPGGPYTICSSDIANIVVTTTPGGGTWSGGTGSFGSTSNSSTTYDPSAAQTGTAVTLTWTTVDPDNSGPCPTVTANVIVNVLSAAIADAQGPYATCGISPVNITAIANGAGTWTGGAGTFANATSVSTTYTPTAAEIGTTITLTWETFDPDNTGPCNNAIDTAQLTISTPATATPGGPYTICSSDIANIVVTTTPGGGTWSGGTGAFGTASNSSTTYDPSATETATAVTLTWTTVDPDNAGPCPVVTADVIVNVLEAAIADAQGPYATCGNTPVNITAITNGNGTWTGGAGTFADATSASTTYTPTVAEIGTTITLTWETFDPDNTGPCNNAIDTAQLSISTPATATPGGPYTICSSDIANIVVTTTPGGGTWSGGTGAFGTASNSSTTYDPSATETATAVTLTWTTVDPDNAGPCPVVTTDVIVNVLEAAIADAQGPYATCGNTPVNITAITNGNGTWTGGAGTFADATSASTTYTPTVAEIGTTITLTWETFDPDNTGPCNNAIDTAQLTISTPATATPGGPYTICSSDIANIVVTTTPGGGTWSGGTGAFGTASNSSTTYDPSATETATAVTLTWTTVDPDNAGPCPVVTTDVIVNVLEAAIADAQGPYATCGNTPVNITATTNGTGTWTGGAGTFANASNASTTYTAAASEIGTTVTLTWETFDPDNTGPCNNAIDTADLTISTPATATPGGPYTICSNGTASITVTTTPGAGTWTGGAGSFDDNTSSSTIYTPLTSEGGTTIDLLWTTIDPDGSAPCPAVTATVEVSILEEATASIEGPFYVCSNAQTTITVQSNGPGEWNISPNSFGSLVDNNSFTTSFTPSTDLYTNNVVTLQWTTFDPDGSGPCAEFETTDTLFIQSLPIIDLDASFAIDCGDDISAQVTGGSQTGYSYSWSPTIGLISPTNITTPVNASGQYTLSVTDSNGCTNSSETNVLINALDQMAAADDTETCLFETVQLIGSATLGEAPFTYNWTPTTNLIPTNGSTATISFTYNNALTADSTFSLNFNITDAFGCSDNEIVQVTVHPLPVVNAGPDQALCADEPSFHLSGYSPLEATGLAAEWLPSSVVTPSDLNIGNNIFTYTFTDLNSCTNSDQIIINIHEVPVAEFSYPSSACEAAPVSFTNQSTCATCGQLSYQWIFGDVLGTSLNMNPIFTFQDTGYFDVKLITSSPFGCQDSISQEIHILALPETSFTLDQHVGCGPIDVAINNTTIGAELTYDWNIEPFGSSNVNEPGVQTFPAAPCDSIFYFINLNVTNICGTTSYSDSMLVYSPPQPLFSPTTDTICSTMMLEMYNTTECAWQTTYNWDFGDDITSDSQENLLSHIYYAYDDFATYPLTLTAENECGIVSNIQNITVVPNSITAFFNADPIVGCEALPVSFDQEMFGVTYFTWDYGDGTTSTTEDPDHIFENDGFYEVIFIAGNFCGAQDTATQIIEVLPAPEFNFTSSEQFLCVGESTTLTPFGDPVIGYAWNFGDGNTSNEIEPSHIYNQEGDFTVSLTAISTINGCPNTVINELNVITTPVAQIITDTSLGCPPLMIEFSNNSINATNYYWTLGDGNFYVGDTLLYSFDYSGTYNVQVIAVNSNSCTDTTNIEITVYPQPTAAFDYTSFDSPDALNVLFQNLSANATAYQWNFDDGFQSYFTDPFHQFAKTGECTYYPSLIAFNNFGCTDTATSSVSIPYSMVVYAPNTFTPNGDFLNDVFEVESTDVAPSTSHLQIFNRWGVMIHESRGDNPTWNGLIDGEEAPNDVYLWKYEARLNCGFKEFEHVGHVTLVR